MKQVRRHLLVSLLLFSSCNVHVEGTNSLRGASSGAKGSIKSAVRDSSTRGERNLIIGGNEASLNEYPYFAHFDSIYCGGSLIAPDIVLTAGHVSCDHGAALALLPHTESFSATRVH